MMLLERVDALTEELHAVKEGLADARTRLAVAEKRLADARAQLVVPGRNVCIEEGGGLHASQWFMNVLTVEPLTAAVMARRVLGVLPQASVIAVSRGALPQHVGVHLAEAYVDAQAYVNLTAKANAIDAAIFADHTRIEGKMSTRVVNLARIEDVLCVRHDTIELQRAASGLANGTLYTLSVWGRLEETDVVPVEPSAAVRSKRRLFPNFYSNSQTQRNT
jgi:hypothetical protein